MTVLSGGAVRHCMGAVRGMLLDSGDNAPMSGNSRLGYSSAAGRVCPRCGLPERGCKCGEGSKEQVPDRPVAKLRMEKAGRGGKTVTVVYGLPHNDAFLKDLAKELKRACGT